MVTPLVHMIDNQNIFSIPSQEYIYLQYYSKSNQYQSKFTSFQQVEKSGLS